MISDELHPPRLPESFLALQWGDYLAAFGLGLLAAALILALLGPFFRRRIRPATIDQRLQETRDLPAPQRLLALTRILTEMGGTLPEDQRNALYQGRAGNPEALEALIRGAARR